MNYNTLNKTFMILLLVFSCTGRNSKNYISKNANIPVYESHPSKDFILTNKINKASFPLEVSTESYSNLKESVDNSNYPSLVYTEELLNSFAYNYPPPVDGKSLGLYTEIAISPWDEKRKLVLLGINSRKEERKENIKNPSKNLVFAIDTSGSMNGTNGITLAKSVMKLF